jgi:imidazolonepropionase-like amidohydrolase
MSEAGLTPYEVLQAATRNAAEFLNSSEFGTIAVGKKADLLFVDCNPLKDLSCVEKQTGVMVRGRWLAKQEFKKLLELNREN